VPSKVPDILPLARGHSAPVLDTAWSPFDDSIVASAGEDGKVCVFKVAEDDFSLWGDDKWTPRDWEPETKINAGGRKAGQLLFHPTASNVLAVASGDHIVRVFDIENAGGGPKIALDSHDETIQGLTWNQTGTLLATVRGALACCCLPALLSWLLTCR
jgi:coronin-1B/1C/6